MLDTMKSTNKKKKTIREPELTVVPDHSEPETVDLSEAGPAVEEKVEEKVEPATKEKVAKLGADLEGLTGVVDGLMGNISGLVKNVGTMANLQKETKEKIEGLEVKTAFLEAKVDAIAGETSKMAEAHTSTINTHSVIHAITLGALAVLGVVVWKGRTPKA